MLIKKIANWQVTSINNEIKITQKQIRRQIAKQENKK